jgi:1D-myo-inositol 3-kinase
VIPDYLAIGHITQDVLPEGGFAPGGTVTFAALAAHNLNAKAAIVTAAPPALWQLPLYQNIQIQGPQTPVATIFENIYRPQGRIQFVRAVAPVIQAQDVPLEWRKTPIVHLAPIAQECAPNLIDLFPGALIGLTPQGFLRAWDKASGQVYPVVWADAAEILPKVSALILSEEDLPPAQVGRTMLAEFIRRCPLVVCTQGSRGCMLYFQGRTEHIPAYPAHEIDPTGAGDVFAAALLLQLHATSDPVSAARFANAAASCSVERTGPSNLPTLAEVQQRMSSKG